MKRYALVVGIAQYDNLKNLTKPTLDAEAVAQVLEKHGNFQEVKRLPENWIGDCCEVGSTKLTGEELTEGLRQFLLEQAVNSEALIYFSGHGIAVVDRLSKQQEGFLATSDCKITEKGKQIIGQQNGISLRGLNNLVLESQASSLVVLLDCCHAGSLLQKDLVTQTLAAFSYQRDYYSMAACRAGEQAWQGKKYSVFTAALLKGLAEENAGSDGQVSCDRVFAIIDEELRHSGQEPIRLGWGRPVTLVQYPPESPQPSKVVSEECPYQGLRYFDESRAQFFFGRRKVVETLKQKLDQGVFVPVIGTSGSGKSSVVQAGLIPWLKREGTWQVLEPILPSIDPLTRLKQVFDSVLEPEELVQVYEQLENAPDALEAVISQLPSSKRFLLVVDQFEEVFTLCPEGKKKERDRFIQLLTQVTEFPNSRLSVIITMRADFLDACLKYQSLTQLIQQQAVYMPPLTKEDFKEIIVKPAELQGYSLGEGLLEVLLKDVGEESEYLPLLEFTLTELWQPATEQEHRLTLAQYQKLGEVSGALDGRAEEIYLEIDNKFGKQGQELVKRLCLSLLRTGLEMKDTRQRQPKAELLALAGEQPEAQKVIIKVLEQLIKGRLLVSGGKSSELEEAWVDLSHEALIKGWKRFAKWREEDRDLRRLVDRVKNAHRDWLGHDKDEQYLMMGGLLTEVRENWKKLEPYLPSVKESYQKFYQQSYANEQKTKQAIQGSIEEKAQGSVYLLPTNPVKSLVLAIETIDLSLKRLGNVTEPVPSLLQKVLDEPLSIGCSIKFVAFTQDSKCIVSGHENGTIGLWNLQGNLLNEPFKVSQDSFNIFAFSPDSHCIVSGSDNGVVSLWNLQGQKIGQIVAPSAVSCLDISSDGQWIVSGSKDKIVRLWQKNQDDWICKPLNGHTGAVRSVAFSSDGRHIASGGRDRRVRLWDIQGKQIGQPFQGHRYDVNTVAISGDGKIIASAGNDHTVRLWNLQGEQICEPLQGDDGAIYSVAFSPSGEYIASGATNGTIRRWNLQGEEIGDPFRGHEKIVYSVAFSPDGNYIVSGGKDGTLRLWPTGSSFVSKNDHKTLLKVACNRLRYHPALKNSEKEEAKAAREICHKYIWSQEEVESGE
ncbi:MAG: hypothetical protein F6J86_27840 [Symploca sp. SIO1B1]|nr:hypothetical protein [Symploca sp. SIO1B1]